MVTEAAIVEVLGWVFGVIGWIGYVIKMVADVVLPNSAGKSVNVLVIGSGGLGFGLARRLALRGATIAFWDASEKALAEAAERFGAKIITDRVDITNRLEVAAAYDRLCAQKFEVDILLNAAGLVHERDFLEDADDRVDKMIDVNLKGVIWPIRSVLPTFYRRRSGHVVTIASLTGTVGFPHGCEYSASKFGARGYMEALRVDALARGIPEVEFTTLNPGFVQTPMLKNTNMSGQPRWSVMSIDEACDLMLPAILQSRASAIVPWRTDFTVSLKRLLPTELYNRLLARHWMYPKPADAA